LVGEGGHRLSGGQRQRLAIARAILKDAPFLILDEATSSVDNETEAALQRSISKISVGRTTMIIAHRLSTVRNADRIIVLDNGKITESGSHDELVALGNIYSRLWSVQTGEIIE
jgi:ATP-binding cassette subfamily B protein